MDGFYLIIYFSIIDIIKTLTSPFFMLIFIIIYFENYKLSKSKYCLSVDKVSPLFSSLNSTFYGAIGGVIATVGFIYLEVVVVPMDFFFILLISVLISFINTRFMCIAYSGSIICLVNHLFGIPHINTNDIMLMVSTFHIVESVLIFLNGNRGKAPAYFEKNGEFVGGFNIHRFWPLPFVIFIGDGLIKPIALMAVLHYGDFTLTYPRRKILVSSIVLLIYGFLLLIMIKIKLPSIIPPLYALVGHEFIVYINELKEKSRVPIYTNGNKGVRVIDVSKRGIAKDIGINTGDIIVSINELTVNNSKDIEEIEYLSNKYWKINYFSSRKGLNTKVYQGNKKSLGISVVPRGLY
ncbi:MAG: PDZ domain-containing protein [Tissierellia bacterium]|nr:PDZ domain-containing protein [Tissierellia bacterium]